MSVNTPNTTTTSRDVMKTILSYSSPRELLRCKAVGKWLNDLVGSIFEKDPWKVPASLTGKKFVVLTRDDLLKHLRKYLEKMGPHQMVELDVNMFLTSNSAQAAYIPGIRVWFSFFRPKFQTTPVIMHVLLDEADRGNGVFPELDLTPFNGGYFQHTGFMPGNHPLPAQVKDIFAERMRQIELAEVSDFSKKTALVAAVAVLVIGGIICGYLATKIL